MPAEFMTMISELFDSLLSTCATAISSAIGAITRTSSGMISPVMPTKTRMVLALVGHDVDVAQAPA